MYSRAETPFIIMHFTSLSCTSAFTHWMPVIWMAFQCIRIQQLFKCKIWGLWVVWGFFFVLFLQHIITVHIYPPILYIVNTHDLLNLRLNLRCKVRYKVLNHLFKSNDTVLVLYDLTESVLLEITKILAIPRIKKKYYYSFYTETSAPV